MIASNSHRSARNVREQSRRVLRDVKGLGSMAIDAARERGEEALDQGRDMLEGYQSDLRKIVVSNPFRSVLVALGVGALLGFTLRGR